MEKMKLAAEALLVIGDTAKVTAFGFTDDEIGEFIEIEKEWKTFYEDAELEWKDSQLSRDERAKIFLEDGVVTEAQVFEWRRQWYLQQYEESVRKYFEAEKDGYEKNILTRYKARVNQSKEVYEIFTYRPYDDKSIKDEEINRARERNIGDFIKLDSRGFAICPFHNERTPSFHVHSRWNRFYCFGCGAKGDVIEFIRKQNGFGFKEAVKYLIN